MIVKRISVNVLVVAGRCSLTLAAPGKMQFCRMMLSPRFRNSHKHAKTCQARLFLRSSMPSSSGHLSCRTSDPHERIQSLGNQVKWTVYTVQALVESYMQPTSIVGIPADTPAPRDSSPLAPPYLVKETARVVFPHTGHICIQCTL